MRNLRLTIEYDGTRYGGWMESASGHKETSVQEKITDVLVQMEGAPVELIGAIRTEAGVHAYRQIANFHTASTKKTYEVKQYLNRYLPRDIAVLEVQEAEERFHAAFQAKSFVFEYHIAVGEVPSVFERRYQYYCFKRPDVAKMREAAAQLVGTKDFRAFSDNRRMKKSTLRTITAIEIYADEKELVITIKGDDFWPNMVRNLVGTLLAAGHGELSAERLPELIAAGDRTKLPIAVEPKGLFLADIRYT